eukprot:6196009-Pleurochrysis_carterae.AAC.1
MVCITCNSAPSQTGRTPSLSAALDHLLFFDPPRLARPLGQQFHFLAPTLANSGSHVTVACFCQFTSWTYARTRARFRHERRAQGKCADAEVKTCKAGDKCADARCCCRRRRRRFCAAPSHGDHQRRSPATASILRGGHGRPRLASKKARPRSSYKALSLQPKPEICVFSACLMGVSSQDWSVWRNDTSKQI